MTDRSQNNKAEIEQTVHEWNVVRADQVFSLEYGRGLPEKKRIQGNYPVVGSNGIVGFHTEAWVKGPGIVIGRKGTVGAVSWIGSDFWPIDTTYYVKTKVSNVDLKWLYYQLTYFNPARFRVGDIVPGLNRELVHSSRIPLPSFAEQQQIALILSTVDEAIQKTDEIIAKTQQLKKGLMQQLLTKGIGDTKFKQTEIGEIPEEWEVVRLGELTIGIKRGPSMRTNADRIGIIYLTSDYIDEEGTLRFTDLTHLDTSKVDDVNKYLLQPGDLLVNCVNSLEKVGKVATFNGYKVKVMVGFNNFALTLDRSRAVPDFLKYFFLSPTGRRILRNLSKAAVQQVSFSSKDLLRLKVPLPALPEQEKISWTLSECDAKVEVDKVRKQHFELLKKGLMQVLLTGKVRVKVN